ncbi:MAG TPA: type IV secretory system conjugative DNA transfer family protein [Jatrophihabitans sp.]|nr:type IV secretory system conjugative DNA transfer family protein [Jatrophihabitans sp.]
MNSAGRSMVWRQINWARPIEAERAVSVLRQWAADQRSPHVVLEASAEDGEISYRLAVAAAGLPNVQTAVITALPGTTLAETTKRPSVNLAMKLKANTRHRALRSDQSEGTVRAVLGALAQTRRSERLVLQVVLGPRRVPLAIPTNSPSSILRPWYQAAWHGNGGRVDSEKRAALRSKVGDHGFACTVRIGVSAGSIARRRALVLGLLAAIRTSEAAGVALRLRSEHERRLNEAGSPLLWPLRLNVRELLALTAWPLGSDDLPGIPADHPKPLAPTFGTVGADRVVGQATAPGLDATLQLPARAALQHLHVIGPTGVGKSVLLGRLVQQDIEANRAVVVIEPKGDLVDDVLARIPRHRQDDVVVLDAADSAPVGLNPLAAHGQRPEVIADLLLSIFKALYADAWGPRTQDILHACLLTLAGRRDATLVMLPLLLTNAGFRRSITAHLRDPLALEPFWAWYENLSENERARAIAPLMNKLRQWLLRPSLRAVLGQRQSRFDLRQVFTERKILLVPLRRAMLGPEAASLLGSLVVAQLWQAIQARAAIPVGKRYPVLIVIDEAQDYLHLPTDLGDALAQARGYGVGFTLAHQYLGQLPTAMRSAILSNARSRICFQLQQDDAFHLAKGHPELAPEDFTALGQYQVYASLFARGQVTPYASGATLPPSAATANPEIIKALSRQRYGRPLDEVEAGFAELLASTGAASDGDIGRRRRPS